MPITRTKEWDEKEEVPLNVLKQLGPVGIKGMAKLFASIKDELYRSF